MFSCCFHNAMWRYVVHGSLCGVFFQCVIDWLMSVMG